MGSAVSVMGSVKIGSGSIAPPCANPPAIGEIFTCSMARGPDLMVIISVMPGMMPAASFITNTASVFGFIVNAPLELLPISMTPP